LKKFDSICRLKNYQYLNGFLKIFNFCFQEAVFEIIL